LAQVGDGGNAGYGSMLTAKAWSYVPARSLPNGQMNEHAVILVAVTVGVVVGLAMGIGGLSLLRRARLRREAREHDPWWQWQKQWERVEIGLRRIDTIYEGRQGDSTEALYDLFSFFLNCYHLRDWLAADRLSAMSYKKATKVIERSTHLRVCDDLVNRTGRAVLARCRVNSKRSSTPPEGGVAHRWEIVAGDATFDALELALNCVAAWETALTDRRLLVGR
jgi:hypothetical protein